MVHFHVDEKSVDSHQVASSEACCAGGYLIWKVMNTVCLKNPSILSELHTHDAHIHTEL